MNISLGLIHKSSLGLLGTSGVDLHIPLLGRPLKSIHFDAVFFYLCWKNKLHLWSMNPRFSKFLKHWHIRRNPALQRVAPIWVSAYLLFHFLFYPQPMGLVVRPMISKGGFSTCASSTTLGVVVRRAVLQLSNKLKITYKKSSFMPLQGIKYSAE